MHKNLVAGEIPVREDHPVLLVEMMNEEDHAQKRSVLINIESIVDQVHMRETGNTEEDQVQEEEMTRDVEIKKEEMAREEKVEKMEKRIKNLKLIRSKSRKKHYLNKLKKQVS